MNATLYTTGYLNLHRPAVLLDMLEKRPGAIVCDIRMSPVSRIKSWGRDKLAALLGERYRHVVALGNRNYRGGPIALVDQAAGVAEVLELLRSGRAPVLLCACREYSGCHRRTAAEAVAARVPGIEIVELGAASVDH